jgi:hypothetical protein
MNKIILWLLPVIATLGCWGATPSPNATVLLRSYYRYLVTQQVGEQVQTLTAQLPKHDMAEVQAAMAAWTGQRMEVVRQELLAQFGEEGRLKFEKFFTAYSAAESKNDPQFLHAIGDALGANQPYPADFAALRQLGVTAWLQPDIQASSRFLTDVQMWLQLKDRTPNMPPLAAWLARDLPAPKPVAKVRAAPRPPPTIAQQLAGAEAPLPEFKPEDETTIANPLDSFIAQRKERRDRIAKEAQEAMASVAAERQQAEQELAAKKQAEAQADAEAVKNHAQRLAQAENDAMEQEKNSWTTKLKGLVGATISAAGGAFFGGIGAQAGQMAANLIFQGTPGYSGVPATMPTATPSTPAQ